MNEINTTAFYKRLLLKGYKSFSYVKAKWALSGAEDTTDEKEKKQLISVLDDVYKEAKENILKS
jgi:hypothetical protein